MRQHSTGKEREMYLQRIVVVVKPKQKWPAEAGGGRGPGGTAGAAAFLLACSVIYTSMHAYAAQPLLPPLCPHPLLTKYRTKPKNTGNG